jgi:hypothetical protein
MPVIILRPDNFLDPDGKFSRVIQASTGEELLEKVKDVYRLGQTEGRAEILVYTSSIGYSNRQRLDILDVLPGMDPLNGWVFIKPIHRAEAPPAADPVS